MPGDAMAPDEPQTLAGEQHRLQFVKDRGLPGRCRGAHRVGIAMDELNIAFINLSNVLFKQHVCEINQ